MHEFQVLEINLHQFKYKYLHDICLLTLMFFFATESMLLHDMLLMLLTNNLLKKTFVLFACNKVIIENR